MKRLTNKENGQYRLIFPDHIHDGDMSNFNAELEKAIDQSIDKLGQLEEIEDELGIDFLMLDKICKNGVYCYKRSVKDFPFVDRRLGDIIHIQNSDIHIQFFGVHKEKRMGVSIMGCIDYVYHSLPIENYGKTWALTKEELL